MNALDQPFNRMPAGRNGGEPLLVRIAAHPAERAALIALRTQIYRDVGKHDGDQEMTDTYDADAYLVGVWRGATPIASARVICRAPHDEWEHDRFITWNDSLPPRSDCAEVSRFCVLRAERGFMTLRLLLLGVLEAMLRSGRCSFIACCTDEQVPLYRRFVGAEFVGQTFRHDDLGPKPHHLFRCDYTRELMGGRISTWNWLAMWPSAARLALTQYPALMPKLGTVRRGMLVFGSWVEPLVVRASDMVRPSTPRR
jgi:hypothetical protein